VRKTVVLALAFGDIYDEAGEGRLIQPVDGAVERLRCGLRTAKEIGAEYRIFCTAGFTRQIPCREQPKRLVSLADQMLRFLSEDTGLASETENFTAIPLCWSTEAEVQQGIQLSKQCFVQVDDEVTLVIATNWAHIPRVWIHAKKYLPAGWELKLVCAHHAFGYEFYTLEPLKVLRDATVALYQRYIAKKRF
jgi:hypothetical protein